MNHKVKIITTTLLIISGVVVFYILYKNFNPGDSTYAPKCLSYTLLDIRCPGCGLQRAVHSILNGEIMRGIYFNPLIVLSIPYVVLLMILEVFKLKHKLPRLYTTLYGQKSIWILLIIIIVYTLMRNIFKF